MKPGWRVGLLLYGACFLLSIVLRWPYLSQSYTSFEWITAHSHVILNNWLAHGFWNERGLSLLNPPAIEFPTLLSREPYVSYPGGAQVPLFVLAAVLGLAVTPGFFDLWGLLWYGLIGLLLMAGLWLFGATLPDRERRLGAVLVGLVWLGGRGPLSFFPTLWYADIAVLLPFVLVGLAEVILAHDLLEPRHRQGITWSLPVLVFWGMYTDWLFVPLGAVVLVYRLRRRGNRRAALWPLVWQIMLPAAVAVTLFLLQVFWLLGPRFLATLLERFQARALDSRQAFATSQEMLSYFAGHFTASVGGLSLILAALALLLLVARQRVVPRASKDFLMLLTVPSLLLWLIFRQHAAIHAFSAVKFMIPIAVLLGTMLPWACQVPSRVRGLLPQSLRRGDRPVALPGQGPCPGAGLTPWTSSLLVLLVLVFLLYEGWQYRLSMAGHIPRHTLAWGEAVRRHFGPQDVLFTLEPSLETPAMPPMRLALSGKRIYPLDVERVALMRQQIPAARMFLIGTASVIEAFCAEPTWWHAALYACRL